MNLDYSVKLDKRILESKPWPQVYLTDPPCTCVHIEIEYAEKLRTDGPVLSVRRHVRDPAGVTLRALYDAMHAKGLVAAEGMYRSPWEELRVVPDTTIREQLQNLDRKGLKLSLIREGTTVNFCHLCLPTDAEFEEMRRNGRVEADPSSGSWW